MKLSKHLNPATAVATAAMLLVPAGLAAQDVDIDTEDMIETPTFDIEARSGISTPAGELADYAGLGYYSGAGVAWNVGNGFAIRVDGGVNALDGDAADQPISAIPDMRLWDGLLGIEYDWTQPESTIQFSTRLSAGVTQLETDMYESSAGEAIETEEAYPTASVGADLGFDISDNVRLILGSEAFLGNTDEGEFAELSAVNDLVDPLENPLTFSHSAGLSVDLPN